MDYFTDSLGDLAGVVTLVGGGLSCSASMVSGLFGADIGSCDTITELKDGVVALGGSVIDAVADKNWRALLDVLQSFVLPDRCHIDTFELDYCIGYAAAALTVAAATGGSGASSKLAALTGKVDNIVPEAVTSRVDNVTTKTDDINVPCRSFSADTHVLLADGTTRPISQIQPGDLVLATNPETGQTRAEPVEAIWPHQDQLLDLETSAGTVTTTEDHHFWNTTDRQWQETQDLDPGDQLRTPDGDTVTVQGLDWATTHTGDAYDLTINDLHTYHVLTDSNEPVLVHNTDCPTQLQLFDDTPYGPRTPAQVAADNAAAGGKPSGAAAQFEFAGSEPFVDVSGSSTPIHPEVQAVLDSTPEALRAPWHGGCAEPRCVSQALEAGLYPVDGTMTAVQIGD